MVTKTSNHQGYYDQGGISVLQIWDAYLTDDQKAGLFKGNVLKYVCRAGKKDPAKTVEDLVKARDYLDMLIDLEQNRNTTSEG